MPVFISHSFENKPEFENIADALETAGVPYWNPGEVKAGSSLREQLRAAVENCAACVFLATRSSIESSWCGAELGTFWGSGKPIIVYLAEASLPEDKLPPLLQGDIWERRISRVVARTKEIIEQGSTEFLHVLLQKARETDKHTPFFIYAGSNAPQHKQEASVRGALGSTNVPRELVDMVLQALPGDDRA